MPKKNSPDFLKSVIMQRMANASSSPKIPTYKFRGCENRIPSLSTGVGVAPAKPPQVYTGTKMIGICQMSKSNAVPVFTQEEILDIGKMRR